MIWKIVSTYCLNVRAHDKALKANLIINDRSSIKVNVSCAHLSESVIAKKLHESKERKEKKNTKTCVTIKFKTNINYSASTK